MSQLEKLNKRRDKLFKKTGILSEEVRALSLKLDNRRRLLKKSAKELRECYVKIYKELGKET